MAAPATALEYSRPMQSHQLAFWLALRKGEADLLMSSHPTCESMNLHV